MWNMPNVHFSKFIFHFSNPTHFLSSFLKVIVVNSVQKQNHTNERKTKMCGAKVVISMDKKGFKQQQQQSALKPSVEQHHKHKQAIRISNKREEQTHQALLTQFGPI